MAKRLGFDAYLAGAISGGLRNAEGVIADEREARLQMLRDEKAAQLELKLAKETAGLDLQARENQMIGILSRMGIDDIRNATEEDLRHAMIIAGRNPGAQAVTLEEGGGSLIMDPEWRAKADEELTQKQMGQLSYIGSLLPEAFAREYIDGKSPEDVDLKGLRDNIRLNKDLMDSNQRAEALAALDAYEKNAANFSKARSILGKPTPSTTKTAALRQRELETALGGISDFGTPSEEDEDYGRMGATQGDTSVYDEETPAQRVRILQENEITKLPAEVQLHYRKAREWAKAGRPDKNILQAWDDMSPQQQAMYGNNSQNFKAEVVRQFETLLNRYGR